MSVSDRTMLDVVGNDPDKTDKKAKGGGDDRAPK